MAVHQGEEVGAVEDPVALAARVPEHVAKELHDRPGCVGEGNGVRRPVVLGHLAGSVRGRLQARCGLGRRTHASDMAFDRGVSAPVPYGAQLLEGPLGRDLRVHREQFHDAPGEGGHQAVTGYTTWRRGQRGVGYILIAGVLRQNLAESASVHTEGARGRPAADALSVVCEDLVNQFLAVTPRGHRAGPFRPASA